MQRRTPPPCPAPLCYCAGHCAASASRRRWRRGIRSAHSPRLTTSPPLRHLTHLSLPPLRGNGRRRCEGPAEQAVRGARGKLPRPSPCAGRGRPLPPALCRLGDPATVDKDLANRFLI